MHPLICFVDYFYAFCRYKRTIFKRWTEHDVFFVKTKGILGGLLSDSKYMDAIKTQPLFNLVKLAMLMMGKWTKFMISAVFYVREKNLVFPSYCY